MAEVIEDEVVNLTITPPKATNGSGGGDLEKYYNYLKTKGADVPPSYQSFHATLQNETEAKKYYDYVKSKGYDAPETFESFSNTLGLKKKENSTPQVSGQGSKTIVSPSKSGGQSVQDFSPVEKGNIDLAAQPSIKNPEVGGMSTVFSRGVNIDGKEVLLTSVTPDGKFLSEKEAIDYYKKTGKHLGKFNSVEESNAYAKQLHEDYESGKIKPLNDGFSPVDALLGGKKPEEQLGALGLPVMGDENKPKQDLFVPPTKGFQEVPTTTQNLPLKELNESQMVSLKEPLIQEGLAKLKLNPNDEDAKYQIAEGYRKNGIDRGAEFYYNDILKTNPANTKALQGIAYVSQQKGDYATALDNYKKVAAIEPNNVNVANGIAFNAFKTGNLEEARAVNDAVLASDPKQPNALFTKSLIQNNEGDKEGADKTLTEATDQWLLSQEAPSLVNQAYMDYLTNGGAETFRSQIDPFKGTPFEAAAHTLWEGGKNTYNGFQRVFSSPYNSVESHLGMWQALQGEMEVAFGVGMSSPAGMEFIVGLDAADVFTNDYASKLLMTPLDVISPIPTDENGMNTESELDQRKRALGNAVVSLVALHLAKPAIKTTVKKISDAVPEYSKEQIAKAKEKWDNGEEMNGEEIKQLHQAIASELTPENLKQLSKVTETIPEGTKNVSEVSGKLAAIEPETLVKIPPELAPEKKIEVAPLVEEKTNLENKKAELEASKQNVDDSFHPAINKEIKTQEEQIAEIKKDISDAIKQEGLKIREENGLPLAEVAKEKEPSTIYSDIPKELSKEEKLKQSQEESGGVVAEDAQPNFEFQRQRLNEEFSENLKALEITPFGEHRLKTGEFRDEKADLKNIMEVYDDYRKKMKEIDKQEELSSQPKTENDNVPIENAVEAVKPVEEVKTEEIISPEKVSEAVNPVTENVTENIIEPKIETNEIKKEGTDSTTQKAEEVIPSEQGGEKVVAPTSETEGGKMTGITHEQTNEIARELGFEEYKEKPETIAEWDAEADKRISEGYNIEKLVRDMESGKQPDKIEQRIIAKYVANLKAQVEKAPTDANILELKRVVDTSNISGGREVAKSLRARVGSHPIDDSLAGFFLREMDVNKDAPLTEGQKSRVVKEHADITEAQKKYDAKIATLEAENSKLRAEAELKKTKATTKKTKKTKDDFVAERKSLIEQFKEEGKFDKNKPQAQGISLTNKQVEIIGKLVKSYVEEGISRLEDVVTKIAGELGLEKKDVHDVLAGEYNPKKKTRSEIAATIIDLKEQARLTNKLDALLRGEIPKNEKQKIQRNQEIEGLRKQIKDLQKEKADAERKIIEDQKAEEKAIKDAEKLAEKEELNAQKAAQKQAEKEAKERERITNQKTPEEQALANLKKRYAGEIKNLEEQIRTGDFSKPSDKPKLKLDAEARKLKDDLIKLKKEREVRLLKQQYEQRTLQQKATDKVIEVLNIPRTLMSSMDFSAPLRQAIVATVAHPRTAAKAGVEMFKQAFSQKQFDRWFYDVKDHPRFERSQESGLYIADPHDPRLTAKEEAFMNNLAEKIPVVGKLIKGSERAYVGYLNKMRWDLFNRFADAFEAQGKTFENSPDLYKGLASYVNNSTGRGKLGALESAAPILNAGIFAPRLIASRLNLLNPLYYKSLPKEVRVSALKDMGKFIGVGLTVLAIAKLNGAEVEDDPRSSDFGKIKDGNTRWDIWGGFQPYMRVLTQLFTGQSKSSSTGKIQELDGEGAFGRNRGDVVWNFMRGKLAPVPSMAVNFLTGKTMTGEDVTIKGEAIDHLLPMIAGDLKDAVTDRGTRAFFEVGIPSTFGIGTSTYLPRGYEKVGNKEPVYKFLYDNHLNLNEPQQGELTDDEYTKMLELREPIFKNKWQDIIDKGALINKEGKVTTDKDDFVKKKPVDKLTQQELSDLMKAVGNSATRKAKSKVLPKDDEKESHAIQKPTSGTKKIQQK